MNNERNSGRENTRRRSHRRRSNSRVLYYILLIGLLAILAFSAFKIISYLSQQKASEEEQNQLINDFVNSDSQSQSGTDAQSGTEEGQTQQSGEDSQGPTSSSSETKTPATPEPDTISVDIAGLKAKYPDVKAYIYCANTGINYAIVKGSDNEFYLSHGIDGTSNNNGALFIEQLCDANFGSQNTIIYGHHMKSGRMFAPLENYKNQSYYEAHPYMYIYTESQNYRLDLFAGFVCEGDADIYATAVDSNTLANYVAKSTFKSKIGTPTGKIVTLSTCDYTAGYNDARYVVLGALVPIS